jgi:hypothetical protein
VNRHKREPRIERNHLLVVTCTATAAGEAAVLLALGHRGLPLAAQVSAIPPLGLFHDLRWLVVSHRSWLGFSVGLAAVVGLRAAATTGSVWLAWPRDEPYPGLVRAYLSSVVFSCVAALLLAPMVVLVFGIAVVPFSWPYLAAVPGMLLVALLLSQGGVTSPWSRALPPRRALEWLLASFMVLSAVALTISRLPAAFAVPLSGAGGLFNAWAWHGLTATLAHRKGRNWPVPITPLAAATLLLAVVVLARLGFALAGHASLVAVPSPPPSTGARAVLVVDGFGSPCCAQGRHLQEVSPDLVVQQFSYDGLDAGDQPIPHGAAATNAKLSVLGDRLALQVDRLQAQTGRRVDVVAESEGTLVVYSWLAHHASEELDAVVFLSPIVFPGQVTYPVPGREGQGVVAGWGLRAITSVIGTISPLGSDAHTLLQSVSANGSTDATSAVDAACRAGIRSLLVIPLADAVTLPETRLPNGVLVVPAFHGGLLGRLDVQTKVRAFLDGQRVRRQSTWIATAEVIAGGASAWRVPVVVPHLPQSCANGKRPPRQQSMPTQSPDSGVRGSPGRVA